MDRIVASFALALSVIVVAGCPDEPGPDADTDQQDTADTAPPEDTADSDEGGDTDPMDADTAMCELERPRTVSGTLELFPAVPDVDSGATLADSQLTMISALSALQGDPPALTQNDDGMCVDATMSISASGSSTSYTFEDIETGPSAISSMGGLAAEVDDSESNTDKFVQTFTALAGAGEFQETDAGVPTVEGRVPFAVTNKTVEEFGSLAGTDASDLLNSGLIVGQFIDDQGDPVEGVKLGKVNSNGDGIESTYGEAYYPSADYSSVTQGKDGGSTSTNGVFYLNGGAIGAGFPPELAGTADGTSDSSLDTETQPGDAADDTVFAIDLVVMNTGS